MLNPDNLVLMSQIRQMRALFAKGLLAGDALVSAIAEVAYMTGARGDAEQFITMFAYEHITGLTYDEAEWI